MTEVPFAKLHWDEYHWSLLKVSQVNIGSGNGLVPSGNKPLPEPKLMQICHHMMSLGHNELTHKRQPIWGMGCSWWYQQDVCHWLSAVLLVRQHNSLLYMLVTVITTRVNIHVHWLETFNWCDVLVGIRTESLFINYHIDLYFFPEWKWTSCFFFLSHA